MQLADPEVSYGEMAVACVLRDGNARVLPWPAYAQAAERMAQQGRIEITECMGRKLYRLRDEEVS